MIVDFHTHAFADVIAERAINRLLSVSSELKNFTDGTAKNLSDKLHEWNVDIGVLLPIATKASQQDIINSWAAETQKNYSNIVCFGSVFPFADDAVSQLEKIKATGLHGIKLHPDYQDFFMDDEKVFPVYEKCEELSIPVIFHAGFDPLSPDLIHCTPQMALKVHKKFPEMTMILAHLGGMRLFDEVENLLAGEGIYFDTAYIKGEISDEQLTRIIRKNGADRILLGSDCPWNPPTYEIEIIKRLPLTQNEKDLIMYKNALRLLKL